MLRAHVVSHRLVDTSSHFLRGEEKKKILPAALDGRRPSPVTLIQPNAAHMPCRCGGAAGRDGLFWHGNQRPDGSWLFFLVDWAAPTSCQSKKKTLKKCFSLNLFAVMWSRTLSDSPTTPPHPLPLPPPPTHHHLPTLNSHHRHSGYLTARIQRGHVSRIDL